MIITDEIRNALVFSAPFGDIKRVREHMKNNKCICTGDSTAVSFKRIINGWLYKCYRCGEKGKISLDGATPKEVLAYVKPKIVPTYLPITKTTLPADVVPLSSIPVFSKSISWLLQYRINKVLLDKYQMYWSENYRRIIFPILNTNLLNPNLATGHLLGWIGREPDEEKVEGKHPKWLKRVNLLKQHTYYHIETAPGWGDKIVIVEDIISAIRVHETIGCHVIALLGTELPTEFMLKMRGFDVKIWFDKDAVKKSISYWTKCCSLGVSCKYIYTQHDPKNYAEEGIKAHLGVY